MEEKHKNLVNTRQKAVIQKILAALSVSDPNLYYLPTIELAAEIKNYIHNSGEMAHEDFELVRHLKRHDIQILLSLH